jgi:serine protease
VSPAAARDSPMFSVVRPILLAFFFAFPIAALAQGAPVPQARVIVQFKAGSPLLVTKATTEPDIRIERAKALAARNGRALDAGAAVSSRAQVVTASGVSSQALADELAKDSEVEFAVPDERRRAQGVPNDPLYSQGLGASGPAVGEWYLHPPDASIPSAIDAQSAWDISIGSPTIIVADVDTGVRFEHPDLLAVAAGGNLLPGYDMISDVNVANDGDGRDPDASDPGDWVTQADLDDKNGPFYQCQPDPSPSSWHGTRVSGILAALTNNSIGMASVGRTIRVLPVRALGKCGGYDSDIIAGMMWAAGFNVPGVPANTTPARVINLSLGGPGACTAAYQQAIAQITAAGVTIVAAAGNSSGHAVGVPANCPGVIAVTGLRQAGDKVGFADLGPENALAAPAGNCVNTAAGSPCLYPIVTTSDVGTTVPVMSTYTDGLVNPSFGTSFSTPLVAGTAALMLSTRSTLMPAQIRQILQSTARPFPTTGGSDGTPQCTAPQFDAAGNPIDQLECYCTTNVCGAGMLDTYASVLTAQSGLAVVPAPYEGIWWAAPAASESGWGLNLAQQGDVLFATWFTYDTTGKAWWLVMTATRVAGSNTYNGTWYQTHGPPFNAVPFDPAQVIRTAVGTGTLTFTDANDATFTYTVNGITQTKAITRQVFGTVPTCRTGLLADPAVASNYQDLWWATPAGSESGWGINLVEEGNTIFATWFTYDLDGSPLWLAATATTADNVTFTGTLYRTTGPAFDAMPFDPAQVSATPAGTLTIAFASGNSATFSYTVNGISQAKTITREIYSGLGTTCR